MPTSTAPAWTVSGVTGIVVSVSGTLMSRAEDSVTIVCAGPLAAAAAAGTAVSVACGEWSWSGEIKTSKLSGTGAEKTVVHQCRGLYYKLSEYTYKQARKFVNTDTGALYTAMSAFVTLFQNTVDGSNLSADDQIADAVGQTGLTLAECSTGLILPQSDESGITVKGLLEKIVALAPKCAVWIDAAGALHVAPGPAVSLTDLVSYTIGARADLGVRGVVIEVMGIGSVEVDGLTKELITQTMQSAGATTGAGVCYIPFQSQGLKVSIKSNAAQTADVVCESIPSDLTTNKTFWISHIKDLSNVAAADLDITEATALDGNGAALDTGTYPRIALTPVPEAIDKETCDAVFNATVSYIVRSSNGDAVRKEIAAKVSFSAVATDANTGTYTLVGGTVDSDVSEPEYIPDGTAASLYAAWNETFAEGTLTFHANLLADVPVGGRVTAKGVSGYIQSIQFDSSTNMCVAQVSPPDQSGLQSMVKLQEGLKRISNGSITSFRTREEADPAAGAARTQDVTQRVPPAGGGGSTPGVTSLDTQNDGSEAPEVKITRDIEDITDTGVEMKYRKIALRHSSEGNLKKSDVWILSSAPAGDDDEKWPWSPAFSYTYEEDGKTIATASVTFENCKVALQYYTLDMPDQSVSSLSGSALFVGVRVEGDGTAELITGDDFSDIADVSAPPANQTFSQIPICKLAIQADGTWARAEVYFGMPQSGIYGL